MKRMLVVVGVPALAAAALFWWIYVDSFVGIDAVVVGADGAVQLVHAEGRFSSTALPAGVRAPLTREEIQAVACPIAGDPPPGCARLECQSRGAGLRCTRVISDDDPGTIWQDVYDIDGDRITPVRAQRLSFMGAMGGWALCLIVLVVGGLVLRWLWRE